MSRTARWKVCSACNHGASYHPKGTASSKRASHCAFAGTVQDDNGNLVWEACSCTRTVDEVRGGTGTVVQA